MVYVINGQGGCGKDTFVQYIREYIEEQYLIDCHCISSVALVKEAAYLLGWDGVKDDQGRKFLSDLKLLSTEAYDGPLNFMLDALSEIPEDEVVFFMIREPEEIERFKEHVPSAKTILIDTGNKIEYGNMADDDVFHHEYDYVITNNGTLLELEDKAIDFIEKEFDEKFKRK